MTILYSIDDIKKKITPIAERYNISHMYLFGSYARNEATEKSDIDILIDRKDSKIKSLFQLAGLQQELQDELEKNIDVLTEQALEDNTQRIESDRIYDNILRERVVLYERQ
ncbi:MAG: nucleotidyltransferase domain-containing protein [Clostridiales Family XIII bacterium]|jgi:predicted nucleotidyltransferase|nr:nucleotidyltransferase domain-containing protein [Clostridiales Family XIII bacterium]